jgi:hypothetical protein
VSDETNAQKAARYATGLNTVDKAKIFAMLAIADAIHILAGVTHDAGRAR